MEKRIQNSDRISNLPEPIKTHILSYLSTRDAARTSILSSSWRALWIQLPIFDFGRFNLNSLLDVDDMPSDDDDSTRMKRESIVKEREEFYAFLDRTLGSISKLEVLKLYIPQYELELKSRLDHWLDCVVGCRVRTLSLEIGGRNGPRYSLPKSVLSVNFITTMNLKGCELISASLANTQLPSVTKLSLVNVYLDEGFMGSLAVSIPNLEALAVKSCKGFTRLEVFGLTKLVKLDVGQNCDELEVIVIDAPSLLNFIYVYEDVWKEVLQSSEIEFSDCKNLKFLKLVGSSLYDSELNTLLEDAPVLEKLFLYECHNLEDVSFSSQHLTCLEFERCRSLLTVQIDTPNLKIFHYADDELITFRGKCSFKLKKAPVYLKADIKNDKWYARLVKFLSKLGNSEQLSICVGLEEVI
ncbi:putative FBD-associated F-box protein At5g53635 [Chenopodium quinoa]|uniref:putative FBD-associated F-box protein At5g53635 n=1 Tax=Chenopodium quinoa TaxID=63459 RepID=UPI000B779C43|nr:putative FBD-associated F-box protein At5g53635 [Chenopodium quinoa]